MPPSATTRPRTPTTAASATTPWWRVGMVWLVLSGPAVVVVAGIATAVIAYRGADQLMQEPSVARSQVVRPTADTPAVQARNHAATAAER